MQACWGGLDALAMGGGLCEHVPTVPERLMQAVAWLGCELAPSAERGVRVAAGADVAVLSSSTSKVLALAVSVDEERVMAEQALAYLRTRSTPSRR